MHVLNGHQEARCSRKRGERQNGGAAADSQPQQRTLRTAHGRMLGGTTLLHGSRALHTSDVRTGTLAIGVLVDVRQAAKCAYCT